MPETVRPGEGQRGGEPAVSLSLRNASACWILLLSFLLSTFAAAGCLPSSEVSREESAGVGTSPSREDPQGELEDHIRYVQGKASELAFMIHDAVNRVRSENGLRPLEWDQQLAGIALAHSRDMSQRDYFDHLSPEGEDFADRYRKNGYTHRTEVGDQVYLGAENLFLNSVYSSYLYDQETGERVSYNFNDLEDITTSTVEGWMESEGHRRNILSPFTHEGIGVHVDDEGRIYITQNFS